jgi:hypothetical protein
VVIDEAMAHEEFDIRRVWREYRVHAIPLENPVSCRELGFRCAIGAVAGTIAGVERRKRAAHDQILTV